MIAVKLSFCVVFSRIRSLMNAEEKWNRRAKHAQTACWGFVLKSRGSEQAQVSISQRNRMRSSGWLQRWREKSVHTNWVCVSFLNNFDCEIHGTHPHTNTRQGWVQNKTYQNTNFSSHSLVHHFHWSYLKIGVKMKKRLWPAFVSSCFALNSKRVLMYIDDVHFLLHRFI